MEKNQSKVNVKNAPSQLPGSSEHQLKEIKKHVDDQVKRATVDVKDAVKGAPKR